MKRWGLLLLMFLLAGCPSREFVLKPSEIPWAQHGIARLAVPAFKAEPRSWTIAEAARLGLTRALDRGTVDVTDVSPQAVLEGAVVDHLETSTAGPPRRVQRSTGSTSAHAGSLYWEVDVTHRVDLRLALRLVDTEGGVIWTREGYGSATETQATTMNWPGHDPMPPPAVMPHPAEGSLFDRLRERALAQALTPLTEALTVRYSYEAIQ